MRRFIPAILASLLLAVPPAVAEGGRPIPQDPEKREERFRELLAWNRKTLEGSYDRAGRKDPRWDKPAREALEAAARNFSRASEPFVERSQIFEHAKQAIDAGCDDGLILYLYYRSSVAPNNPGPEELERRAKAAAASLERSGHEPLRRAIGLAMIGWALSNRPESRRDAARWIDLALALLPESVREDDLRPKADADRLQVALDAIGGRRGLGDDPRAALEHVEAALAKAPSLKVLALQARASFLTRFAWEARGDGLADTVTEEGWRKMNERLTDARESLDEAWKLKPGDALTATQRLGIEIGLGGDRDEMEKWFDRAMRADGDNLAACQIKMDWLDPKWHGSIEDMMEFGRACAATGNWRSGIPLLLGDALQRTTQHLPEPPKTRYYLEPGTWEMARAAYTEFLGHFPGDRLERTRYAVLACHCRQFAEAHRQFQILGDDLVPTREYPEEWLKSTRVWVAERAGRPSGPR